MNKYCAVGDLNILHYDIHNSAETFIKVYLDILKRKLGTDELRTCWIYVGVCFSYDVESGTPLNDDDEERGRLDDDGTLREDEKMEQVQMPESLPQVRNQETRLVVSINVSSRCPCNSEAFASELQENLDEYVLSVLLHT